MAVDAGGELANVTGPKQQRMAHGFGFSGSLPKGGDEEFTPKHCFVGEILIVAHLGQNSKMHRSSHFRGDLCENCSQIDQKTGCQSIFMLLRFRFSNFRSFRTEQEFSLVEGSFTDAPES